MNKKLIIRSIVSILLSFSSGIFGMVVVEPENITFNRYYSKSRKLQDRLAKSGVWQMPPTDAMVSPYDENVNACKLNLVQNYIELIPANDQKPTYQINCPTMRQTLLKTTVCEYYPIFVDIDLQEKSGALSPTKTYKITEIILPNNPASLDTIRASANFYQKVYTQGEGYVPDQLVDGKWERMISLQTPDSYCNLELSPTKEFASLIQECDEKGNLIGKKIPIEPTPEINAMLQISQTENSLLVGVSDKLFKVKNLTITEIVTKENHQHNPDNARDNTKKISTTQCAIGLTVVVLAFVLCWQHLEKLGAMCPNSIKTFLENLSIINNLRA